MKRDPFLLGVGILGPFWIFRTAYCAFHVLANLEVKDDFIYYFIARNVSKLIILPTVIISTKPARLSMSMFP